MLCCVLDPIYNEFFENSVIFKFGDFPEIEIIIPWYLIEELRMIL